LLVGCASKNLSSLSRHLIESILLKTIEASFNLASRHSIFSTNRALLTGSLFVSCYKRA
jgi:hypothetical protein